MWGVLGFRVVYILLAKFSLPHSVTTTFSGEHATPLHSITLCAWSPLTTNSPTAPVIYYSIVHVMGSIFIYSYIHIIHQINLLFVGLRKGVTSENYEFPPTSIILAVDMVQQQGFERGVHSSSSSSWNLSYQEQRPWSYIPSQINSIIINYLHVVYLNCHYLYEFPPTSIILVFDRVQRQGFERGVHSSLDLTHHSVIMAYLCVVWRNNVCLRVRIVFVVIDNMYTYNRDVIERYCRLSSLLEVDQHLAQQAVRQATSRVYWHSVR